METSQKITAIFDNKLAEHAFLSYIEENSRLELIKRLQQNQSVIVGFSNNDGDTIFVAVFDFETNCLHVREVGGFFGRYYKLLDDFTQGLAKYLNVETISFNSSRRAVVKWADKMEYQNYGDEYVKRIK